MPSYQSTAPSWLHVVQPTSSSVFCGGGPGYCREVPDVSANSDPRTPYLIYWNGSGNAFGFPAGWQGIGGTSGATPLWAAVFALANASSACQGLRVGFANPLLYEAAAASYGGAFNDVATGNNDFTGTNGGRFPAVLGYDMATGLGSPNATSLVAALCAQAIQIRAPAISGVSLTGIRRAQPQLQFTASAGQNAPALKRVAIRLPTALRFARQPKRLTVIGPNGHGATFSSGLRGGVLTITVKNSKSRIRVTIGYPAITVTPREVSAARRGRSGKLRITVTVSDARWHPTPMTATVNPRS
jgi:hypothetical protein